MQPIGGDLDRGLRGDEVGNVFHPPEMWHLGGGRLTVFVNFNI